MKKYILYFTFSFFLLACAGCRQDQAEQEHAIRAQQRLEKIYQEMHEESKKIPFYIGNLYLSDGTSVCEDAKVFEGMQKFSEKAEKVLQEIEAIKHELCPKGLEKETDISQKKRVRDILNSERIESIKKFTQDFEKKYTGDEEIIRNRFFDLKNVSLLTAMRNLVLLQLKVIEVKNNSYKGWGSNYCGMIPKYQKKFILEERNKIQLGEEYVAKISAGISSSRHLVYAHFYVNGKKISNYNYNSASAHIYLKRPVGKHRWNATIIYLKGDNFDTLRVSREFEVVAKK